MDTDRTDGDGEVDVGCVRQLMGEDAFKASCAKEMALLALMEKTGYNIVQENGQRKYGGPPPDWEGPPPPRGCEVFVGKIPRDIYEDELVPLFGKAGEIYEFRLMLEFSGENRGYAFAMYTNREAAQRAIQMLDNYQIRPRKFIGVCVSLDNCRLVICPIPKDKRKDQIMEEMKKVTDGVVDVILVPSSTDTATNPGFAFVEYECHKAAAIARRKLIPGPFQLWGQSIQVDWGEPEVIKHFRVLYVQNLMLNTTEDTLRQEFSRFKPGSVEGVKKLTDYAFVHYRSFDDALAAFSHMNGAQIDGATVNMTLTKPRGLKGSVAGRKPRNRGYASAGGGGGGGGGGELLAFHRNNGGMMGTSGDECPPMRTYSPCLENPFYSTGDHMDRRMFPRAPGTQLITTSLLSVSQAQMRSAVSLLEFYCCQNQLAQPEYFLYSTPGQDGTPLLLYKVVISDTWTTYVPNKLCLLLEDAKELAAQTALCDLVSSNPGKDSWDTRCSSPPPMAFGSCLPPPRPVSPVPHLSLLPYPPPGTQRHYISPQSPFY